MVQGGHPYCLLHEQDTLSRRDEHVVHYSKRRLHRRGILHMPAASTLQQYGVHCHQSHQAERDRYLPIL
uniref:Uncharacterized protein n=1 Tax=Anguilla anguilla TaxID=7936 RepID=A0A0E9SZV1_ANGAN